MTSYSKTARLLAGMAATSCLLAGGAAARANTISIQDDLAGLPAAVGAIHALALPQPSNALPSFSLNGGSVNVALDTGPNQGVVSGSLAGYYAAPVSGGTVNQPTLWSAPYFSTGLGYITLTFSQAQTYFGLLWGSVDHGSTYNYIEFLDVTPTAVTWIATITGNDIYAATQSSAPNGAQGYGGSYYVGLQDTAGIFNEIVLGSSVVSFEAADIQYADATVSLTGVPEPATASVLGVTALGLLPFRRRRAIAASG